MDREGPSRLQPSAATTKVKKSNGSQAASLVPPIVVEDDSPATTIVRQKNLVISIDIPPSRPFKVVKPPVPPPRPFKVVKPPKSKATPAPPDVICLDESIEALSDSEYYNTPQADSGSDYEDRVESRKRKAKTIGGTRRVRHRIPSSDVEVIEPLPKGKKDVKGKGKETASRKERARARYREVTSDSEEEQKPEEVKESGNGM
jgi:hypothetical protein